MARKVRLPLYGPAQAEGPLGPLPVRRKALGILYYLALEGPTRREKLADLLWGHGAASQNLRVELTHLRGFFGREAFRGRVLELPPGVELDQTPGANEVMEGLEDLSPEFTGWLQGVRARLAVPKEALPIPERLKEVRPPALVVLVGPPGSGRRALARSLAERLGLPFRDGLGSSSGVFYLSDPLPSKEEALRLRPTPGQVLVVARSAFGEDPSFLLALRTRFPAEITRVLQVPRLGWGEVRRAYLRNLPFERAARFYLESGGRPEILRELLALDDPEALPQRVRAMVALEARHLPEEARRALEVLSLHPGPFPPEMAEAMGVEAQVGELERRGWLLFVEGRYRWAEPQFRRYLSSGTAPGERLRLHRRLADFFRDVGDLVAEAYHRWASGQPLEPGRWSRSLVGWRRFMADPTFPRTGFPLPEVLMGLGSPLALDDLPEELELVSWDGEAVEVSLVLDGPAVVHLEGQVYQRLPLGMGVDTQAFPFRLFFGDKGVYFLPSEVKARYFWGAVFPQNPLDYLFFLLPGIYHLGLGTQGLAVLTLKAYRPASGTTRVLAPLGQLVEV
ncbi:hypothetical protein [Thermus tenuipuniceus]|uniref:hypothetical protein n=1 Tax=Thermus tenuipuniceus TaxID=2078690 RepID=UPI000CF9C8EB|nr:hypothetical protein [Thermus tenuipuniceus]